MVSPEEAEAVALQVYDGNGRRQAALRLGRAMPPDSSARTLPVAGRTWVLVFNGHAGALAPVVRAGAQRILLAGGAVSSSCSDHLGQVRARRRPSGHRKKAPAIGGGAASCEPIQDRRLLAIVSARTARR
jgi:hypothetical protein